MKQYVDQIKLDLFASARREVLAVVARVLVASIFVAVSVYSLISIGQQINFLILSTESGPYLSITLFSGSLMVCVFVLYRLLAPKPVLPEPNYRDENVDLARVLASFYKGFLEGLNKRPERTIQGGQRDSI